MSTGAKAIEDDFQPSPFLDEIAVQQRKIEWVRKRRAARDRPGVQDFEIIFSWRRCPAGADADIVARAEASSLNVLLAAATHPVCGYCALSKFLDHPCPLHRPLMRGPGRTPSASFEYAIPAPSQHCVVTSPMLRGRSRQW